MLSDPEFPAALEHHLARGSAWCVRDGGGAPGSALLGGLLWCADPPRYTLGWLAVAARARRSGIARRLLDAALAQVVIPATVRVTTFAAGVPGGEAARQLYMRLGFVPEGPAPVNPAGLRCEVLALRLAQPSTARAVIEAGGRSLLAQHHYRDPANLGKWSLLGGRLEPHDRDPATTVRRELAEELQAEIEVIRPLHIYPHAARLHHVFRVRLHAAESVRADPHEVAALGWFTPDEVAALDAAGALFAPFIFDAVRHSRNEPPLG